jgi:hypothetical protein
MNDKYAPGRKIYFPWTGNTYIITDVDDAAQTVTFALPFDLADKTTETVEDLDAVDAQVRK